MIDKSLKKQYWWLFDRIKDCIDCQISESDTYAYWTASSVASSNNEAWIIDRAGYLKNYAIDETTGVRPVITVLKSKL